MAFTDSDLKHPAALERVRQLFEQARFLKHVGITLTDVGPGWAELAVAARPELTQGEGFLHAGLQATLADHASGTASGTLIGLDETVLAVEFKVTLLRPAAGERLTCRADVIRAGRRLMFTEAKVFAHQGADVRQVASFSGTVAVVQVASTAR
jgi:uncharacterized protein (TIGR00369 family)